MPSKTSGNRKSKEYQERNAVGKFQRDEPRNLLGSVVGVRTVVGRCERHPKKGQMWLVECMCGKVQCVQEYHLRNNTQRRNSCGCLGSRTTIKDWAEDIENWERNLNGYVSFEDAESEGLSSYGKYSCSKCGQEELFSIPRTGGCYGCSRNARRGSIEHSLRCRLASMYRLIGEDDVRYRHSDLMGCDTQTLGEHIESQFHDHPITGIPMTYDNRGLYGVKGYWQLDHEKPVKDFDLLNEKQAKECCNYKNIQPLWTVEHVQKTNLEVHGLDETLEEVWKRINKK